MTPWLVELVESSSRGMSESRIPVKLLAFCSFLLLVAVSYNSLEGWKTQNKGGLPLVREAALPLQRRMRKSKFVEDAQVEQVVVPEHFKMGVKSLESHVLSRTPANAAFAALPGATGAGYKVGPNGTVFLSHGWARASNASAPSNASAATNTTLEAGGFFGKGRGGRRRRGSGMGRHHTGRP